MPNYAKIKPFLLQFWPFLDFFIHFYPKIPKIVKFNISWLTLQGNTLLKWVSADLVHFYIMNSRFFTFFLVTHTLPTSDPMYMGSNTQRVGKFWHTSTLYICPHTLSRGFEVTAHFYDIRPPPYLEVEITTGSFEASVTPSARFPLL